MTEYQVVEMHGLLDDFEFTTFESYLAGAPRIAEA